MFQYYSSYFRCQYSNANLITREFCNIDKLDNVDCAINTGKSDYLGCGCVHEVTLCAKWLAMGLSIDMLECGSRFQTELKFWFHLTVFKKYLVLRSYTVYNTNPPEIYCWLHKFLML